MWGGAHQEGWLDTWCLLPAEDKCFDRVGLADLYQFERATPWYQLSGALATPVHMQGHLAHQVRVI